MKVLSVYVDRRGSESSAWRVAGALSRSVAKSLANLSGDTRAPSRATVKLLLYIFIPERGARARGIRRRDSNSNGVENLWNARMNRAK